ncbi:hypothetical protein M407DRAFT_81344 [Tulasnella calospora MUT 4182]|uniref:Uncharacterized protein n=1 Tax=Tulasnella calospora MUT 4182 TaxID=1051891 RepID=A0A0C3KGK5_9AGAM|nr:hypothetical protein M407DRAFT_81344 [Tulasnella calospora MUT 4182]
MLVLRSAYRKAIPLPLRSRSTQFLHRVRPFQNDVGLHTASGGRLSIPNPNTRTIPSLHYQRSVPFSGSPWRSFSTSLFRRDSDPTPPTPDPEKKPITKTLRENIYTIPNFLTLTRIAACPVLGWSIVTGNFELATGLVIYAGFTDLLDGWLARRFNMGTVLGSILDPAADKALMTTLTVSLAMNGLLPLPLAVIIIGRDVLLGISAFYWRYISLPPPKTFMRYWDFSIPSAEVHPTTISKYNTALQLLLMTATVFNQVIPYDLGLPLQGLQWIVAGTTIWSGMSYVGSKDAVKIVASKTIKKQ